MALAGAGLAEEVHDLVAANEVQLRQGEDPVAVERGLEGEVEAGERLDAAQPGHLQRRLDPASLAQRELLGQQRVDRLQRTDLAALELADDGVEHLERPGHPKADQVTLHALERRRHHSFAPHRAKPSSAMRWATAA